MNIEQLKTILFKNKCTYTRQKILEHLTYYKHELGITREYNGMKGVCFRIQNISAEDAEVMNQFGATFQTNEYYQLYIDIDPERFPYFCEYFINGELTPDYIL